jgi:hypothetical protein
VKHVEITKDVIIRWFHKLRKNLYIKHSIYFTLLVHRHSCTPDDALVVKNILSFLYTNPEERINTKVFQFYHTSKELRM